MKKLTIAVAMMAVLGLPSCSQDEAPEPAADSCVTITLNAPEALTRADGNAAVAVGTIQYTLFELSGPEPNALATYSVENPSFPLDIKLNLVNGHEYGFLFWGSNGNEAYNVDMNTGQLTVDYTKTKANDATLDGFSAYETAKVAGNFNLSITMERPFALISIGSSTEPASGSESSVSVTGVASGTNLITGELAEASSEAVTFAPAAVPSGETYPVSEYYSLAYAYVLAPQTTSTNHTVTYTYTASGTTAESNPVTGVTLQANYRTNIYGSLPQ